ncbi:hypothetical protein TOPH_07390 [Tolypocladium ophioglossoides CBS 100239]|uniref:Erythromycin esterase n=1 Tax=Tolypocladium ophioglossoides (strain CBS 100239) TaxID=1163406 RepID=A0A0L0N1K6_TOLOC|nr:hypothetical protein TOPH_07390 [Tolypocladium ophioglossoides CBS 100239]
MSPPTRRRSARLAGASVKEKAAPELSSVAEREETPRCHAPKSLDDVFSPRPPQPSTPVSSALKPPHDEMHPSKAHLTTGEPSSALRLGFSGIPSNRGARQFGLTSTPSKIGGMPSAPFTFRFAREAADTTLSGNAQRMMDEIRDQAAKIKADLVAQRAAEGSSANANGRVIATPKGKSGRYSAAHMAEFKKMDSIEGHASAWRAQHGRFTPVKSSLKRSNSKANLDATPISQNSGIKPSPSKTRLHETPNQRPLKRTSSVANLDYVPRQAVVGAPESIAALGRSLPVAKGGQQSAVKRLKQRQEDDTSTARPVSRGDDVGPLSKSRSGLARLMSPTKSSIAHVAGPGNPTISLVPSPLKSSVPGLTKSATMASLGSTSKTADLKRRIISPGRFQRVKSILRGQKVEADGAKSAIPQPASQVSLTPAPPRTDKELPPIPLTTPRRKLTKRVAFTPETTNAAMSQISPSPKKPSDSSIRAPLQAIDAQYPGLDEVLAQSKSNDGLYPDLSPLKRLIEPRTQHGRARTPSAPGTFTFRSDHTIKFEDTSAKGFGAYPGQSSLRHVRGSIVPAAHMPGSFPAPPSPSSHPDKENAAPSPARMLSGTAHGMPNKKRHRASSDEEDAENEAAERAMKKRKNEHVPEGQALLAPRLMGAAPASGVKQNRFGRSPVRTPSRTPGRTPGRTLASASPSKKGSVLSMSRLNLLARPKNRG